MSSDYEALLIEHNALKQEFEENKELSEQYEKELEATNRDLQKLNNDLIETNELLKKQNETLVKEQQKLSDEYKNYKMNKISDIQYYENKIEKLQKEVENYKISKSGVEQKLVYLENENYDDENKIRELESVCEDLQRKLDATLEENIILQNENEENKLYFEEKEHRMNEEMEELKNEILIKEKEIAQLKKHRDFLMKTAYNDNDDAENPAIDSKKINRFRSTYNTSSKNKFTPLSQPAKASQGEKFIKQYSKLVMNDKIDSNDKQNLISNDQKKEVTFNIYEEKSIISPNQEVEVKTEIHTQFVYKKAFESDEVAVDPQSNFYFLASPKLTNKTSDKDEENAKKVNRALDNIDDVLNKIKLRKEKVLNQKQMVSEFQNKFLKKMNQNIVN